jgi:hypothetical protein
MPSLTLLASVILVGSSLLTCGAIAQTENPIQVFKDTFKKAMQAQQPAPDKQGANGSAGSATAPTAAPAESGGPARPLPDIVGLRLGMTPKDAHAALQSHYPKTKFDVSTYNMYLAPNEKPVLSGFSLGWQGGTIPDERLMLEFTPPPTPQTVWRIKRTLVRLKIDRGNVLASLREKYGKETIAFFGSDVAREDAQIKEMWWLLDEHGHPAKLPNSQQLYTTLGVCATKMTREEPGASTFVPNNLLPREKDLEDSGWCNTTMVAVVARMDLGSILNKLEVESVHVPMMTRSARAEIEWLKGLSRHQQQQEIEKSKQVKPTL